MIVYIHFLKGNDMRNIIVTDTDTDCCNNQEFLRKSQKRILIYCLEKCEQSIVEKYYPPSSTVFENL